MAQDETVKRQTEIRKIIQLCEQLSQINDACNDSKAERDKFVVPIQDADFAPADLTHLTTGQVGTFYDFVVPAFNAFLADVANGGRNGQIIEQMRNT